MATNANDPISPVTDKVWLSNSDSEMTVGLFGGLTKREYFSAMNMEGFAASGFMINEQCIREAARRSVIAADALIQSLNANPK